MGVEEPSTQLCEHRPPVYLMWWFLTLCMTQKTVMSLKKDLWLSTVDGYVIKFILFPSYNGAQS